MAIIDVWTACCLTSSSTANMTYLLTWIIISKDRQVRCGNLHVFCPVSCLHVPCFFSLLKQSVQSISWDHYRLVHIPSQTEPAITLNYTCPTLTFSTITDSESTANLYSSRVVCPALVALHPSVIAQPINSSTPTGYLWDHEGRRDSGWWPKEGEIWIRNEIVGKETKMITKSYDLYSYNFMW